MVQRNDANDQDKPCQPPLVPVPGAEASGLPPTWPHRSRKIFFIGLIGVSMAPSAYMAAGILAFISMLFGEAFSLEMPGVRSLMIAIALCSPYLSVPGFILSLVACCMGGSDLRAMRAGRMSREGRGNTVNGFIFGILGMPLNGLYYVVLWFLMHFAA